MPYFFTSESVSEGHPDKVADQISDAILDALLSQDPDSRVACETLVTTGQVVVAGEVTTKAYVQIDEIVRKKILEIGYNKASYKFEGESCGVLNAIHGQSPDIAQGVDEGEQKEQGAGDQGMMFGYATNETPEFMPLALSLSHKLLQELARIRKEGKEMTYLGPDAKSQVTVVYGDDNKPKHIDTIVLSTQHDEVLIVNGKTISGEKEVLAQINHDIKTILVPRVIPAHLLHDDIKYHINPTGKFVIGGPHGDSGLTGRKIIVDTYGGKGAHGGGAFSGKDSSKVDRSAAYATRHIAKNAVAAGLADEILVQVAYAIGVAEPVSLYVNTYGTAKVALSDAEIAQKLYTLFPLKPADIQKRFGLKNPIFSPTAAYGHMGREPYTQEVEFNTVEVTEVNGVRTEVRTKHSRPVEFFTWEKLDYVETIKSAFGI